MKSRPAPRLLTAAGAGFAAAGVALSAYVAHGAEASQRDGLRSAALFALAHGIALAALSRQTEGRIGMAALWMLAFGVALFSGSLAAAHFFGASTAFAPIGGMLMIGGWLVYATDALRR